MTTEPPKRRWFQFKLRTLLMVVLVLSLPLSWFAVRMEKARRQVEAAMVIQRLGGDVRYNYDLRWARWSSADPPDSMRRLVGNELALAVCNCCYGLNINWVECEEISDEQMSCLTKLDTLEYLCLEDCRITDRGLKHLMEAQSLRYAELYGTQVTPEGVKRLQEALPNCMIVY